MSQNLEPVVKVKFQNTLEVHIVSNNILSTVLKIVSTIPALSTLKLDIELTLHICKLLESLIINNPVKIDKKKLVLDVLITVFPDITDNEKLLLGKQIEFFCSNNHIILDAFTFYQRLMKIPMYIFTRLFSKS